MAVRIKWNRRAFAELRTMPEVLRELDALAEGIADRAGEGFTVEPASVTGGRVRGRAAVITSTRQAQAKEAREHTLEASL